MSKVVDHLAELTGFRDRDVLDVTLVGAFRDLLQPESATIFRPVGDGAQQRWLTRARLRAGDSTPSADSVWIDLDDLPALDTLPDHLRCLQSQDPVVVPVEGQVLSLFPLNTDREVCGVLELRTAQPLRGEQSRLVSSMLRVFRNFQGLLDYSERDTLTGFGDIRLAREIGRDQTRDIDQVVRIGELSGARADIGGHADSLGCDCATGPHATRLCKRARAAGRTDGYGAAAGLDAALSASSRHRPAA